MAINWTKIYKNHKGLWVALDRDEETVLSNDKTLKGALEKARKKGFRDPIMTRVPSNLEAYVG